MIDRQDPIFFAQLTTKVSGVFTAFAAFCSEKIDQFLSETLGLMAQSGTDNVVSAPPPPFSPPPYPPTHIPFYADWGVTEWGVLVGIVCTIGSYALQLFLSLEKRSLAIQSDQRDKELHELKMMRLKGSINGDLED